jgi:hypothetical protein
LRSGRVEDPRRGRRKLRRGKTQESNEQMLRGNPKQLKTDSQREKSSEVEKADRTKRSTERSPGRLGNELRFAKKKSIVIRGIKATA